MVEDFRFPEGFELDSIPYFNTNTFVLDAAALDRDFPLTWFVVRKKVDGADAIQFEHLVGELSAFLSCACLQVQRDALLFLQQDLFFQQLFRPGDLPAVYHR